MLGQAQCDPRFGILIAAATIGVAGLQVERVVGEMRRHRVRPDDG